MSSDFRNKVKRVATRDIVPLWMVSLFLFIKEENMLDIKFVRENPDLVKENIKKKFQDHKLHLVDEVLEEDKEMRASQQKGDELRAERKKISKEIGLLMKQGKKEEAEKVKEKVAQIAKELVDLEEKENQLRESVRDKMLQIPNIIDPSVPIGKDDS